MAKKIDFDINKLPWEAIARVMAPILAPIILAIAWVVLARTNKTVDWLSNVFALAEIAPTIDLNLPPGIVLGSFYNAAEEIELAIKQSADFVQVVKDLVPEKYDPKDEPDFPGKGFVDIIFDIIGSGKGVR